MDINWIRIISYITVIVISNIIPITTIVSAIIGIPIAMITKNTTSSKIIGYSAAWSAIIYGWNYFNDNSFPLAIAIICISILTFKLRKDSNLDSNGLEMIKAELTGIVIVSSLYFLIYGAELV